MPMQKRLIVMISIGILLVPAIVIAGIFLYGWTIKIAAEREADRAFLPLEKLGVNVFHTPVPFCRYDNYYIDFPPGAILDDETISQLSTLNELDEENEVMMTIQTQNVTDTSLSFLKTLSILDYLDVTDTTISDAGLQQLRSALPGCHVKLRTMPDEAPQEEPQQVESSVQNPTEAEPVIRH